ncbi:T9SS type A sorting domain-containing protein, partial [bacterium]|nr:T9SS type A sorting domain-containing protein [bacterium]
EDAADAEMELTLEPPFTPFSWTWSTETAAREEMNAYYHTRFIHQWYKVIDPGFTGLDYSMPVTVNYGTNYDNAFWNGVGCSYGSGGITFENLAMYCDVIYHEFTHGVTGKIYQGYSLPYSGQPGAMNEAWSDYFACTITDEPLMGEGGLYNGSPNRYMRNLYNDMHFPESWQGEVHRDSPFISGALWRIRMALGANITDSLAHYSRYGHADNFFDYLVEVLETDDDDGDLSNGTPHSETIYTCFGHHGIGPGLDPNFTLQNLNWYENGIGGSSGDGDGWPEISERVEMTFQVYNEVLLFPPTAENVVLTVTCSNPDLTITGSEQNLGNVEPNEVVTPTPIQFDIAPDALDRWAPITITITATNTSRVFEYEVIIPIGSPEILLVKDDPTSDVESYVANALHDINVLFDEIELSEHENLPDSVLPEPGLVIWLSGNLHESALTTNDRYLIENYLNRGNRVILSGQDFIDELSGGPFAQNVLEMEVEQDSFRIASLRPTPESPLGDENLFILTGTAGASNQDRVSILSPLGNNTALCGYGAQGDYGIAGLDFYNGHGIVFGFGIEAISGMANSQSLGVFLQELFQNWASDILTAEPEKHDVVVPTSVVLGPAFPNPFNATVQLPYQIPTGSNAELIIFDLLGREVTRIELPHQKGYIRWTAPGSSGIYFAQIRGEKISSNITKLILLK